MQPWAARNENSVGSGSHSFSVLDGSELLACEPGVAPTVEDGFKTKYTTKNDFYQIQIVASHEAPEKLDALFSELAAVGECIGEDVAEVETSVSDLSEVVEVRRYSAGDSQALLVRQDDLVYWVWAFQPDLDPIDIDIFGEDALSTYNELQS